MTEKPEKQEEMIFYHALEKDPTNREIYLKEACGDNHELYNRVGALLQAYNTDDSIHHVPPANSKITLDTSQSPESPGSLISRYKLLEKIGEGGFGVVWVAEQKKPVKRRVALKIIKLGMDTRQVVARFEAERQALALMDHPNIAKVLDAGSTDTGRPYFVMELVRGIPIIEYCDKVKLSIRDRLDLFIKVCNAVQHAHQKGIIHRDIKPSNILVTLHDGVPVPRIIDFGIAKATQQELTEMTIYTLHNQFIGTPAYMSPEQAEMSGLDIDTRSDIYSLGVLLYELLTGRTPFDEKDLIRSGMDEMRRIIREKEPPKPSTKFATLQMDEQSTTATHHSTDSPRLIYLLRGDLDWIVMKALEKDRTRRYETANGFAMDIKRHLAHEPVLASPPGRIYRVRKFTRRHQTAVVSGLLVATAILMGLAVSIMMYLRANQALQRETAARTEAERQMRIAQAVNNFLNKDLLMSLDPDRPKGGEITVMEILDNAAERLEGMFKDAPSIEASIRDTLGTVYTNLNNFDAAQPHLKRALELRQDQFGDKHPDTLNSMANLSWLYGKQRRYTEAEPLFVKVLQIQRKVLGEEHPDTLKSMARLGWLYNSHGYYDEGVPLLVKALEIQRRVLGEEHSDTLFSMHSLAWPYSVLGRYKEAEPLLIETLEISKRVLGEEHQQTLWTMFNLGQLYSRQERYSEAEPFFVNALEIGRRVLGDEHRTTLHAMRILGGMYNQQGRYTEAEPLLVQALEIRRRVLGKEHLETLLSVRMLGGLYSNQGRYNEAEQLSVQPLEISRRVHGEHEITVWLTNFLGRLYYDQGRYNEAEPLLVEALEISRRILGSEHTGTLGPRGNLGMLYKEQGRYTEAEPLLVKTLEISRRVFGDEHSYTLESIRNLIELYETWGKADKAREWRAILPRKEGKEKQ
jgi:serine/threonine protein kinase/tetratricopeptide (TPR) repeat protein